MKIELKTESVDAIYESLNIKVILYFTINYCQIILCSVFVPVFPTILARILARIAYFHKSEKFVKRKSLKVVYIFVMRFDGFFDAIFDIFSKF